MNQYRCETCKKFPAGSIFDGNCPQVNKLPYNWDVPIDVWCAITSMIGCASHSDFQSERERVLDTLDELLFDIEQIHQEVASDGDDKIWDRLFYVVELRKATLRNGEP